MSSVYQQFNDVLSKCSAYESKYKTHATKEVDDVIIPVSTDVLLQVNMDNKSAFVSANTGEEDPNFNQTVTYTNVTATYYTSKSRLPIDEQNAQLIPLSMYNHMFTANGLLSPIAMGSLEPVDGCGYNQGTQCQYFTLTPEARAQILGYMDSNVLICKCGESIFKFEGYIKILDQTSTEREERFEGSVEFIL